MLAQFPQAKVIPKNKTGTVRETVKDRRSLGKRARACREQKIGAD